MRRRQSRSPMAMAKDNHKKIEFLSIGSTVEVSSDEEGFKGAWYLAKILKSNYKRKGKFLIQYETLLSDGDPKELLTEIVDISFIRPLPPPPAADQTYEMHDVVDAFHRDGWWKGVVSKVEVLEEKGKSSKYTVVFENPPEKFDFCSENLRFHFFWTDGKWVRHPKQKRMGGLNIGKGMAVEVNFNGENSKDAWLPAVVVEEVGFNSFLVEYFRSGNNGKDCQMEETVDSFHVRPPPPKLEVRNFEILECVEAFHDSFWKKGTVVKTLTQGRYSVLLASEKEEIQVRKSEIRPHLLWINGTWTGFREVPKCVEQSAHVDNIAKHSDIVVSFTSSSAAKYHTEVKSSCKRMSDGMAHSKDKSSVKKPRSNLLDIQKENNAFGQKDKGEQQTISKGIASEMEFKDCASKETEFSFSMENADVMIRTSSIVPVADHTPKVGASRDAVNDDQALSICFENAMVKTTSIVPVADHTTKVGSSCDAVNNDRVPSTCFGSDREGNVEIVQKESNGIGQQNKYELQYVSEGTASEMDFEDCSNKEAELSDMENGVVTVRTSSIVTVGDHTAKVGGSCDSVNGDQALSTCFGSDKEGDGENQSPAIIVVADSELVKKQEMPFMKSSPLWKHVDSLDVFQFMPQKPHFSPLFKCNEVTREGTAIGHMVNFFNLVKNTAKLQPTEPKEVFDSYLEALADFEMLGFDVKAVVDRINKLFSIKTRQEQLNNKLKEIHSKIAQCDGEKAKLEGEINAIDEMINELAGKRAVKMSEKAIKDSESNRLRMDANRINEDISNPELDFKSQAAAPW